MDNELKRIYDNAVQQWKDFDLAINRSEEEKTTKLLEDGISENVQAIYSYLNLVHDRLAKVAFVKKLIDFHKLSKDQSDLIFENEIELIYNNNTRSKNPTS